MHPKTRNKAFYLVGQNIQTSLSPLLHNTLFKLKKKQFQLEAHVDHDGKMMKGDSNLGHRSGFVYQLYQEHVLPGFQQLLADQTFGGMSITIPFKKSYYQLYNKSQSIQKQLINASKTFKLTLQGDFAKKSKIINTLIKTSGSNDKISNSKFNQKNKQYFLQFKGYNTDIYGIEKVLASIKSNNDKQNIKNVLVLGAGATSQTFCHYFEQYQQCQTVYIHNRTPQKTHLLHQLYPKVQPASPNSLKSPVDMIVNTLPTQIIKTSYPEYQQLLGNIKIRNDRPLYFMDVNYRSMEKYLQRLFKEVVEFSGLDMLIWQAIQQNRLFCTQLAGLNQQQPQEQNQEYQYFKLLKEIVKN